MANLKKRPTSVSSRAKSSRISPRKLNIKGLDSSELLSTIFEKRSKSKIKTKIPMTLNGKTKQKTKNLPELHISLDDNWREIYKNEKKIDVKIYNAGLSPAYNAFLETYTTPKDLIRRGASLSTIGHFQERTFQKLETIYPDSEVSIPIFSPGYVLYGTLFEPYFFMCYDMLQDPKPNIQITESTDNLLNYLIDSALEDRKLLYLEPRKSSILYRQKPFPGQINDLSKYRNINISARR